MFALVADVEKYPLFLPMCESLAVRSRKERDGKDLLVADMSVGYKPIRETFTSQVLLDRAALAIETKYIDGPFKYLNNRWRFEKPDLAPAMCTSSSTTSSRAGCWAVLMGSMFDIAFPQSSRTLLRARADEVYGSFV